MTTKTLFRWEQDGNGGEHGTAVYFPGMSHEVTVTLPSFEQAHTLQMCIAAAIDYARFDARRGLINEIARIQP